MAAASKPAIFCSLLLLAQHARFEKERKRMCRRRVRSTVAGARDSAAPKNLKRSNGCKSVENNSCFSFLGDILSFYMQ